MNNKKSFKFLNMVDVSFFLFLCLYISIDPYKNGVNASNIAAFLPTLVVLLLMVHKNMKEENINKLQEKIKEQEELLNKLQEKKKNK